VGGDSIVGCSHNIFLTDNLVGFLQENNLCTLNRIGDRSTTFLWRQGWKTTNDIHSKEQWKD
jgi:hypothetical protein